MIVSEQAEEILEALWIAKEEKGLDRVKLSELRVMPDLPELKELIAMGIVKRVEAEHICLTEKGINHARDAVRRHRLAERLLVDVLAVKRDLIHETACGFEHHLHRGIDTNVCTLLGHPRICPHGRPIPPGRCCEEGLKVAGPAVISLAGLRPGQKGNVAYLHTADPKRVQMLISMGVVPGVEILLLAGFPSYLFEAGETQFAVDREVANEIHVRVKG